MAEPMNGDFRKLLDEQKKSNELLSSIDAGQREQGTAKEIIKQALPEIANERQLHKQRMKFEKKEGKTEVDEKVEKQTKTIEKTAKVQEIKFGAYQKEINAYAKSINVSMDIIKAAQSATKGVETKERKAAQKRLENIFKKSNEGEKIQIDLAQQNLNARRKEIEQRGGDVEKDALYKAEMLAIEKRRQRLERRNASGLAARSLATFKNIKTITKDFIDVKLSLKGIASGIFSLSKGLLKGAGRAIGGAATSLFGIAKKFALLAFLPALIAFLNSDLFEDIKVLISENLIPALIKLRDNVFIPLKNFFSDVFLGTFENIKILLFGEGGSFDNPKEGSLGSALKKFKEGDIFGGLKDIVLSLTNFLKNSVNTVFEALKKDILEPVFGIDLGDKTFYGVIADFFNMIFERTIQAFKDVGNGIKYLFSLKDGALADAWDATFPGIKNPFRTVVRSISEGQADALSEGQGGIGQPFLGGTNLGLDPDPNVAARLSRELKFKLENIRRAAVTKAIKESKALSSLATQKEINQFMQSFSFEDRMQMDVNKDIAKREIQKLFEKITPAEITMDDILKADRIRFDPNRLKVDTNVVTASEGSSNLLNVANSGNTEINNETYEVHTKNIKSSDSHQSLSSDLN